MKYVTKSGKNQESNCDTFKQYLNASDKVTLPLKMSFNIHTFHHHIQSFHLVQNREGIAS